MTVKPCPLDSGHLPCNSNCAWFDGREGVCIVILISRKLDTLIAKP
jgi:hypothetical protein